MLYFDGSSVAQNLSVGSESDTLTVSGGVPAWGGAASAIYEKVGSFTTTASTTLDCDITDITGTDIAGLYMVFNGRWNTGDLKIKFNGTSSTGHSTNGLRMEGNGNLYGYYETDTNGFLLCPSVTTSGSKGTFQIFANLNRLDSLSSFNCQWSGNGTNVESWIGSGYLSDTNVTTITEVNLFKSSGNFDAGCTLDIYKINV